MLEKKREYKEIVYQLFVELKDAVRREVVYSILVELGYARNQLGS
jgi:hypothetical protein